MKCTNGCCHLKTWKCGTFTHCNIERAKRRRCGIILCCKGQILIVRSGCHFWGFPKGAVDSGETDEVTASRELREEAGITIQPHFIKRNSVKWRVPNGIFFVMSVDVKPKCDIRKIKAVNNNDSSGVGWANIQCMLKNCTLQCNSYFRMFLYGVSKEGIEEWMSKPPSGISSKVYEKVLS